MFPNVLLLCSFRPGSSRTKKKANRGKLEINAEDHGYSQYPVMHNGRPVPVNERDRSAAQRYECNAPAREKNSSGRKKVSNFCDVIQRVAASCLLRPLTASWQDPEEMPRSLAEECNWEYDEYYRGQILMEDQEDDGSHKIRFSELQILMNQMFDAVSAVKRAYMGLQEAHCTWDPERMRAADVAVVEELTRLGDLWEKWRRRSETMGKLEGGWKARGAGGGSRPREVVVPPYEAVVEQLKKEVKARGVEVDRLKKKLNVASDGKKARSQSKRKVSCCQGLVATSLMPELFDLTMCQVREASKSFTSLLLSHMRAAHWDISAAVRSIEASAAAALSVNGVHHAKHALKSYISRKIFQGFEHETFFMDRSLSSLLNPEQYRHDCFTQYQDMKAIDPIELLEVLPACNFSKFCSRKYLSIIHPKMEVSFFGNLEQRRQLMAGKHPRSQFYRDFLGLAKAVWLLHLLAFSLDPPPSLFEADRGAEFHPQYMESVVKGTMGLVPLGQTVGFPVSPGFKLGNGTVIKARVYLFSQPWEKHINS
ncbi:protein GRAVITROPIC IN THE LIGHT 1-like [Punica granatum]|uniref:Protein GRAVITROPIC IN THE LIGHT 1-like n=1 Tax=Punica granatum TaxID=22663 RepID=A0A6P8CXC7_PUNGR|nr:protein GRAVITROPIC IN THE LIGHT 1-like [Punica granatum]